MNLTQLTIFNNPNAIAEGWYWAYPSKDLRKGKIKRLVLMGEDLAIYRGEDGKVRAVEGHCPHMGAHFSEGKVEGNKHRCFFHAWRFNEEGELDNIPCRSKLDFKLSIRHFEVQEKYGLIWIFVGDYDGRPIPFPPELEHEEVDAALGNTYVKACHPSVMMINAIDAHHFASVHHLPVELNLKPTVINHYAIDFSNTTKVPNRKWYQRFIGQFYQGALTYSMRYYNASTGSVTLGPDFLHFYILFASRPNKNGQTEGQTILVTKKRKGILGKVTNKVLLFLTGIVGNYFARGDTEVFKTIKFLIKNPIREDYSIIKFIEHAEKLTLAKWGHGKELANQGVINEKQINL